MSHIKDVCYENGIPSSQNPFPSFFPTYLQTPAQTAIAENALA